MTHESREPASLVAGYAKTWRKNLPEYRTETYTLKYVLSPMAGKGASSEITAEPDGVNSYLVVIAPADTASLCGSYRLTGYVVDTATGGDEVRVIVFDGSIQIKPDPTSAEGKDVRSHARKMVDLLRSTLEKLASGAISSASVGGRNYTQKDLATVRQELARYEDILRREDNRNAGKVLIRFGPL